jgi:magnesium chelatase family protein
MIDRIDIFLEVPKVKLEEFSGNKDYSKNISSYDIKQRVERARKIQLERFKDLNITSNSQMSIKEINKFCILDTESTKILEKALNSMNLSARAYYRIIKLSRTIADLEEKENILSCHIMEALSYRKTTEE